MKLRTTPIVDPIQKNHRNTSIGPFEVVCVSDQFWHVKFNGQVLYTDKYRGQAVKHAKALNRVYQRHYAWVA